MNDVRGRLSKKAVDNIHRAADKLGCKTIYWIDSEDIHPEGEREIVKKGDLFLGKFMYVAVNEEGLSAPVAYRMEKGRSFQIIRLVRDGVFVRTLFSWDENVKGWVTESDITQDCDVSDEEIHSSCTISLAELKEIPALLRENKIQIERLS